MPKKKTPSELFLHLPHPPSTAPIVDTHAHLAATFESYRQRYKLAKYESVFDLVHGWYAGRNVEAVVDVWCEAPVRKFWRELADSDKWGSMNYWFVMGVHPHEAKHYTDAIEAEIIEAMSHPRCVGWGEMGLDYHYDLSPRDTQRSVFRRQLIHAVRLGKPLTIHTREAENDTEAILKELVPKDHPIHIHCFTDTPEFAQNLLNHFPNLYIGITGVITYTSNLSTSRVIQNLLLSPPSSSSQQNNNNNPQLRILLETDAPYMIPANLYTSLPSSITIPPPPPPPSSNTPGTEIKEELKGRKLPVCHTAMIPWTAEFVAGVANGVDESTNPNGEKKKKKWDADAVMRIARDNARRVYGI